MSTEGRKPYRLAAREARPEGTVVEVGGVRLGGQELVLMAGPCAVESRDQLWECASAARRAGAAVLRGDAYKPRTSPYSFQGLGEPGLRLLRETGDALGMPVMAEIVDGDDLDLLVEHAHILRVGARNVQNFGLLKRLGRVDRPVVLKRGFATTLEELLCAAEYVLLEGNPNVILCERGIRTFEPWYRNTFDITAVVALKQATHLPVIADPSHATGRRSYVAGVSLAAAAAGADGLLLDVHTRPSTALCDGPQALLPEELTRLWERLSPLREGRRAA